MEENIVVLVYNKNLNYYKCTLLLTRFSLLKYNIHFKNDIIIIRDKHWTNVSI